MRMKSFPAGGMAVVIGGSGGIGAAFVDALAPLEVFGQVIALSRKTAPPLDLLDEDSIAASAAAVRNMGKELRLVIDATGFLHGGGFMPEKSWAALDAQHLAKSFAINAIGPALLMKHFLPLLPREGKAMFVTLSAKVGSIGDNAAGGWYSYRAAKAALNQLVHTAAIELRHKRPQAICFALHPGTVDTPLSAPFAKTGLNVRPPDIAATEMLAVMDSATTAWSGGFYDYKGAELPW